LNLYADIASVVGQLGMFGFIICGAQAAGLEHEGMKTATWNGATSKFHVASFRRLPRLTTRSSRYTHCVHGWQVFFSFIHFALGLNNSFSHVHIVHCGTVALPHGIVGIL
jgi:hypothetical protein